MTRIEKLQQLMKEEKVDACIISDKDAMRYFIGKGFSCGERMVALLIEKSGKPKLFLNDLFPCEELEEATIVRINDTDDGVLALANSFEAETIGVDKVWHAGFLLRLMELKPASRYVNGALLSDLVRSIKSEEEKACMRKASQLNDLVMEEVARLIQVGKTEKQLAEEINQAFRTIANSEPSFTTIVAFQENCADPHAEPSDKVLEEGMPIIVDMGCRYKGYCSDMTRTFFVGKKTMEEVYDTVLKANLAAIKAVKPGVSFKEIDHAARTVIEEAGYGPYFIHRLGHGIGLSVHEPYDVSGSNEMIVKPGMCFSIEPGIYLPNQGGVRIEDLVIVTEEGCEVLNHYPKDQPVL